jgi:hypothetical protein
MLQGTKCRPGNLLTEKERQDVTKHLSKRKDIALKHIYYAAHVLDPKFNGECLSRDEQIQGTEFIDKVATRKFGAEHLAEVIAAVANIAAKEAFSEKTFVLKSASVNEAAIWWKEDCYGSKLAKVAVSVLSMPPISAATERSFSTYSIVHTAKRNRLTQERASNLTCIAHNLKLLRNVCYSPSKGTEHGRDGECQDEEQQESDGDGESTESEDDHGNSCNTDDK